MANSWTNSRIQVGEELGEREFKKADVRAWGIASLSGETCSEEWYDESECSV
jgi:hypothetical protein